MLKQKKLQMLTIDAITILASAILRALSLHCFIVPNKFAPGGVGGIASIIYNLTYSEATGTGFGVGLSMFLINVPLLILAFLFIKRTLAVKTLIAIGLGTVLNDFVLPALNVPIYTEEPILAAIAGGCLTGAGLALMLKIGGSTGGTDIVGLLMQKRMTSTNVSWLIFGCDLVIVLCSGLVFASLGSVLFSLIAVFCTSKINETILNGFTSSVVFQVFTDKPEELSEAIFHSLRRGVTLLEGKGMYTKEKRNVIMCVVLRREITAFHRILKAVDPHAFAFASPTREVLGQGFTAPVKGRDDQGV